MTRSELIEAMARAMCRAKWVGIFPVAILTEKVEGFWKMEVSAATAALLAIEAAGWAVVPMEPTEAMMEAFQWGTILPGEIGKGTNAAIYRAMLTAAKEV